MTFEGLYKLVSEFALRFQMGVTGADTATAAADRRIVAGVHDAGAGAAVAARGTVILW